MKTFKSFIQLDEINKQEDDELTEDKPLTLFKKDKRTFHPPKPESHQSKTTMKHVNNPNAAEKKAAKDIKPGIKGVRDRLAMLRAAKDRGALKNEESNPPFDGPYKKSTGDVKDKSGAVHTSASKAKDLAQKGLKSVQDKIKSKVKEDVDVDLLSNLYDKLDESNQEIFLNQLEEDAEVLLAFAKTIAEE